VRRKKLEGVDLLPEDAKAIRKAMESTRKAVSAIEAN
jgi:hypothetical protein